MNDQETPESLAASSSPLVVKKPARKTITKCRAQQMPESFAANSSHLVMKKPARKTKMFTLKQCRAMTRKIAALDDIPASVRQALKQVDKLVISDRDSATTMLKKVLLKVERESLNALRAAYEHVGGAGTEKTARIDAQAAAESHLEELTKIVAEKKKALTSAEKAIESSRVDVVNAKAALKVAASELKAVTAKKSALEVVEKDTYSPLKEMPAGGQDGQKRLQRIRKTGKEYGFHGELLSVLPSILKKQPEKRQTFDDIVMQQLEREFAKHSMKMEEAFSDSQAGMDNHSSAVESAQSAVIKAKENRKRCSQELASAEAALLTGKQEIVAARHHVRNYAKDMRRNERDLARAKARVTKLRKGVLADFNRIMPSSTEEEISEEEDVKYDDTVMDETNREQACPWHDGAAAL